VVPEALAVPPTPTPSVPNWESFPEIESLDANSALNVLEGYPEGTKVKYTYAGDTFIATKVGDEWHEIMADKPELKSEVNGGLHYDLVADATTNQQVMVPTPSKPNWETMPLMPDTVDLKSMAIGTKLSFASLSSDYEAEKKSSGKWYLTFGGEEEWHNDAYIVKLIQTISENEDVHVPVDVLKPTAVAPTPAEPGWAWFDDWNELADYEKDEGLSLWPVGAKIQADFPPEVVKHELGVEHPTKIYALKMINGKWDLYDKVTSEKLDEGWAGASVVAFFNQASSGIQTADIVEKVGPTPAAPVSTVFDVMEAKQIEEKLDTLPIGTKFKAKDLEGNVTWEKKAPNTWIASFIDQETGKPASNQLSDYSTAQALTLDHEKTGFVPQIIPAAPEVPTPTPAPVAPTWEEMPVLEDYDALGMGKILDSYPEGTTVKYFHGGDPYIAQKKGDVWFENLGVEFKGFDYATPNESIANDLASSSATEQKVLLPVGAAPPPTPSVANWETMPEIPKDDYEAMDKLLDSYPEGTKVKYVHSATPYIATKKGHAWFEKVGSDPTGLSGQENASIADDMSSYNVSGQQVMLPTGVVPTVPTAAPPSVKSIPADPSKVKAVIKDMKEGDTLTWNEGTSIYKIVKGPDSWLVYSMDTGKLMEEPITAHGALSYVSFSMDAENFKLTSATAPAPVFEFVGKDIDELRDHLQDMPTGTKILGEDGNGATTYKALEGDLWEMTFYDSEGDFQTQTETSYTIAGYMIPDHKKTGIVPAVVGAVPSAPEPPKPKVKPKPPAKSAEQKAAEAKAKKLQKWGKKHPPVTDQYALHVLSHFKGHPELDLGPTLPLSEVDIYARMKGNDLLLGSEEEGFHDLMTMLKDKGLKTQGISTPLGTFWKVSPKDLAAALPGQTADTIKGPDKKEYPKGTTFEEKKTEHTAQEMISQEPGFYKIKPHKTDEAMSVVKVAGTGDEQKKTLMQMLLKWGVTFSGDEKGMPIVGGQNVLAFVSNDALKKVVKTETVTVADPPPQPAAFTAKPIPNLMGAAGWDEVAAPKIFKSVAGMVLPRMGKAVAMGKHGVFRDNHVKVRRVKAADGKVYTEVYGTLAQTKPLTEKKGWTKGLTNIPSSANLSTDLSPFDLHNYDAETGLSIEDNDFTYSEMGVNAATENGTTIAVHRTAMALKNMFRIRIEDGQDVEKELAAAFKKMGFSKSKAMSKVDADTERLWKKWALVRGAMGAKGWNLELKDDKHIWDEEWLDAQLPSIPNFQTKLDSMVLKETFQGHPTWVVMADVEHFKNNGWKFAHRTDGDWKSLYFQLSQGAGWAAQKNKGQAGMMKMAQYNAGASAEADIQSGGVDVIYFRGKKNWSDATGSDGVYMHPRAFLRTDWRRYPGDAYGNATGKGSGSGYVDMAPGRYTGSDVGTETVWNGGAPISDIMCVTVSDESDKHKLMSALKKDGIQEINGVSLDDFILVGYHNIGERIHPSLRPGEEWTS
jgi:hypothetical protein